MERSRGRRNLEGPGHALPSPRKESRAASLSGARPGLSQCVLVWAIRHLHPHSFTKRLRWALKSVVGSHAAILATLEGIVRLVLVSFLAVALLAVSAAFASGGPAPVSKPKTGAAPWPAAKDPMRRARLAGLVPEVNEHL